MSETENRNFYDKQNIYEKDIAPLIKELKLQCSANNMPMFVTVAVENTPISTKYISDAVHGVTKLHLSDNKIAALLLRLNNFDTTPPDNILLAAKELEKYLDEVKLKEEFNINLTDDIIPDMNGIAKGGDKVSFSRSIAKDITDDFLDE